jgi:hypothetical protein
MEKKLGIEIAPVYEEIFPYTDRGGDNREGVIIE